MKPNPSVEYFSIQIRAEVLLQNAAQKDEEEYVDAERFLAKEL